MKEKLKIEYIFTAVLAFSLVIMVLGGYLGWWKRTGLITDEGRDFLLTCFDLSDREEEIEEYLNKVGFQVKADDVEEVLDEEQAAEEAAVETTEVQLTEESISIEDDSKLTDTTVYTDPSAVYVGDEYGHVAGDVVRIGATDYRLYEANPEKFKYYTDAGKVAYCTEADYVSVDDSYFNDAAWIGDSRTLGLADYSGWEADFYCDNGYSAYGYVKGVKVTCQNTRASKTLEEHMAEHSYKKIYVMLGINDCGYGDTSFFSKNLQEMITMLEETQPDAIIYLVANLHIAAKSEQTGTDQVFSNANINAKNVAMAELADGVESFYLDYNELFTDEEGYLDEESSVDGFHFKAQWYMDWTGFFREHAVAEVE